MNMDICDKFHFLDNLFIFKFSTKLNISVFGKEL